MAVIAYFSGLQVNFRAKWPPRASLTVSDGLYVRLAAPCQRCKLASWPILNPLVSILSQFSRCSLFFNTGCSCARSSLCSSSETWGYLCAWPPLSVLQIGHLPGIIWWQSA